MNFLNKILGEDYTALTKAWDFDNKKVSISATISAILTGFLSALEYASSHYLGISALLFGMIVIIIVADFVTGIAFAYKEQKRLRRQIVCAAKGIRSAYKLGSYIVFLFCTNALILEYKELWIASMIKYVHIYITLHIFFWESTSVDENLSKLGVNLGLSTFFKKILGLFQKKVENTIDNTESK